MSSEYIEHCDINLIKIYERNPRKISQKAVDVVSKSMHESNAPGVQPGEGGAIPTCTLQN